MADRIVIAMAILVAIRAALVMPTMFDVVAAALIAGYYFWRFHQHQA